MFYAPQQHGPVGILDMQGTGRDGPVGILEMQGDEGM